MTHSEADQKIKELIDIDFLNTLAEVGRLYGWSGDYVEIGQFIEDLHQAIGVENVNTEPYELEGE